MTSATDEARTLRNRLAAMEAVIDRLDARDATAPAGAIVLRTKTVGTYPTTATSFFACELVTPGGVEAEGASASLAAVATTVYALGVGTKIPPTGTRVVAVIQDGRFAFQYDGAES